MPLSSSLAATALLTPMAPPATPFLVAQRVTLGSNLVNNAIAKGQLKVTGPHADEVTAILGRLADKDGNFYAAMLGRFNNPNARILIETTDGSATNSTSGVKAGSVNHKIVVNKNAKIPCGLAEGVAHQMWHALGNIPHNVQLTSRLAITMQSYNSCIPSGKPSSSDVNP